MLALKRLANIRLVDELPEGLEVVTLALACGTVEVGLNQTARASKDLPRLRAQLAVSQAKLANPLFVERAPAEVVETERAKARSLAERISHLS